MVDCLVVGFVGCVICDFVLCVYGIAGCCGFVVVLFGCWVFTLCLRVVNNVVYFIYIYVVCLLLLDWLF